MKNFILFLVWILTVSISYGKNAEGDQKMEKQISLLKAQMLTIYGVDRAKQQKLELSIAVVDASGQLISFVRMDGAALVTIEVAIGKAKTAAYLKAPSKVFEDKVNAGESAMLSVPNILPLQGGIPIIVDEEVIGAVGVSGASGSMDNAIAETIANYYSNQIFIHNAG